MPKSLNVNPAEVRKPSTITVPPIPVNAYRQDFTAAKKRYGADGLVAMLHDMLAIREFESMLNSIKTTGGWQGIEYNHKGPAHLSAGQEAAAVGQAAELDADDYIFGSHRSHGEILAKSFSAARKLDPSKLGEIMTGFLDGDTLRYAEKIGYGSAEELTENFILFGTLAEIFARQSGFNRGMGGSMHAFFPPFGVMPNNAIVGGSGDISVGAALFKRINRRPGIVIANIGDASMGCGPVWEGMMMSAMDQYRTLWEKELGGAPPMLFNFMNNFYGMGGQPKGETMGFDVLARVGLGVNPEAMHAERVDGYSPLAVADAIERKRKVLLEGRGPVLLDTVTYRYSGHSPSDAMAYRTKEELDLWMEQDAIAGYRQYLLDNGHLDQGQADAVQDEVVERIVKVLTAAASLDVSPRVSITTDAIGEMMFSNGVMDRMVEGEPETLLPLEETRLKATLAKSRFGLDADGKPLPKLRCVTYAEALFEAMIHRFYEDPTMAAFGEENRDWGGAFGVYRGLTEALPYHRLFNTPISEGAIVGAGVGYALSGGRAVAELMYCDFMGRAGDEIFNQMSKWQAMSAGVLKMPLVLRVSVGSKYGAQHSQDWTALCAHMPGLKVCFPATPYSAKGLMAAALRGNDPVVYFESQRIYDITEIFHKDGVPAEYYTVPLGVPEVLKEGSDLTILTVGATLYRALEAADILQEKYGLSVEVIDARFLNPLNYAPIVASVKKTGKIVLASDATERGSFLHTMASNIQPTGL